MQAIDATIQFQRICLSRKSRRVKFYIGNTKKNIDDFYYAHCHTSSGNYLSGDMQLKLRIRAAAFPVRNIEQ
jgi:hypothetical protein